MLCIALIYVVDVIVQSDNIALLNVVELLFAHKSFRVKELAFFCSSCDTVYACMSDC